MQLSSARDEHNPLYLLSAALVLAGCTVWSNSLSGVSGPVIAALLAELYALCLLGGVALLTRLELRRPAVMLALLALLYQWDLTFHTETAVFLGDVGCATTAVWAALFVAKLHLLERALGIRLAPHAWLAALLAAAGLVLGPRMLPWLGPRGSGSLLAVWVFALGVLAQRPEATLTSRTHATLDVDPLLLRRLTRATWRIPAVLLAVHLLFLAKDHRIGLACVVVTAPLLLVCRLRDERAAWLIVAAALGVCLVAMPGALSVAALLSAAALGLRAFSPQRSPSIAAAERDRLVVGIVVALPLSAWTVGHALSLPRSGAQWGLTAVSLGFLLLGGALASSYRRAARPDTRCATG